MTRDRDGWLIRLKAVEIEYVVLEFAASRLMSQSRVDATILTARQIAYRDLETTAQNLDGTYIIRMFAEFETSLRLYWATIEESQPRTKDLIDGLAAKRRVPPDLIAQTHAVRKYRNLLVHGRTKRLESMSLATARGTCCKFLSRLPEA